MPNPNPKRYTRVVSVPLTDDQAARLDAGVAAGTTRSDLIRAAIDAHTDGSLSVHTSSPGLPDIEQALERVLARHGIASNGKPSGKLASADAVEVLRDKLSGGAGAGVPEPWAIAGINTDALRQLQETASAPALQDALAVVLAAAESGELDRADVARIVAARWDLRQGDRLHYDDGQLYREAAQAKPRAGRTVQHRAG